VRLTCRIGPGNLNKKVRGSATSGLLSPVSDCLLRQPASNGSGLAGRYSSALPSRDRVLHPCIDRAPKNVNTNGGFFLPADLIRSIFLPPLAPRALPRFCAVGSEEAHLAVLASVRRSNWTCRFPASSFHRGERLLGCKEGMRWINFTSPSSP
jgi:hypothetical protein